MSEGKMSSEDKAMLIAIVTVILALCSLLWIANWRWRANKRDLIEQGYVQKVVTTTYATQKIIWTKDPNSPQ